MQRKAFGIDSLRASRRASRASFGFEEAYKGTRHETERCSSNAKSVLDSCVHPYLKADKMSTPQNWIIYFFVIPKYIEQFLKANNIREDKQW